RAVGRPVVVGQVEVGHAEVERAAQDGALGAERLVVTEVVPQPERYRRQQQPAATRAAIAQVLVTVRGGDILRLGRHAAKYFSRPVAAAPPFVPRESRAG